MVFHVIIWYLLICYDTFYRYMINYDYAFGFSGKINIEFYVECVLDMFSIWFRYVVDILWICWRYGVDIFCCFMVSYGIFFKAMSHGLWHFIPLYDCAFSFSGNINVKLKNLCTVCACEMHIFVSLNFHNLLFSPWYHTIVILHFSRQNRLL